MKWRHIALSVTIFGAFLTMGAYFAPSAGAMGVSDAQAFANTYCPNYTWPEQKIADYMWTTNPKDGSNNFTVIEGQSQVVPVNINYYVTYCANWPPGYSNGSSKLQVVDDNGVNRLKISPAYSVGYPNKTSPYGQRQAFGPWVPTGAGLDVSGWGTGSHHVCTKFTTYTSWIGANPEESWRACFDVNITRVYPWKTAGTSQVGVDHTPNVPSWDGRPGQTVTWNHGIWNTTQYGTSQITAAVGRSGFRASSGLNGNQYPWWPGAQFSLGPWGNYWFGNNTGNYNNGYFRYVLNQEDVGAGFNGKPAICQSASWGPSSQGGPWKSTTAACVRVPYKFNLTTRVDMNSDVTEPGTTIAPINPYLTNDGPTKSYDDTAWQVSKFIVAPGKPIPSANDNSSAPCAYYANGCKSINTGNGTYDPGDSLVGQIASYVVEDVPIGSRICFALSVNKYDQNQNDGKSWRHGAPACVMVGKKPKVQVLGGDVATRANINVGLTQKTTGVYGRWVEYGGFSVGGNINFASGAGLSAATAAQPSNAQLSWSKLTFANVDTNKNPRYGQYTTSASAFRQLPAIAQYFAAISNQAPFAGDTASANAFQTGGPVQIRTAGDITLHASSLGQNQSVVLVSSGTVTIDGDQSYQDGPFTSVAQLPQLVIIAKNINITAATHQVDAWLIATDATSAKTGIINTCSDGPQSLTGNDCKDTLTIHGPVEARQLLLRRTAGSGTGQPASGDPAEVIDLRADAYLWAAQVAAGAGKAQTVYTTELPPRF